MPYLTTGLLHSTSYHVDKESSMLSVNISNDDTSTVAVQIEGFFQSGTAKMKYVEEFFTLTAGTVVLKNYFVPFNSFEFVLFISSKAVEVSVWSKDSNGNLTSEELRVCQRDGPFDTQACQEDRPLSIT
ncbi:hypothetical protein [Desulfosporosinus sp.]|uniref:hypothetical protein n=1 Tax=Desulfosporosinus sp. TaxID=157907 RepID=UPI0025BE0A50|nr:hypothetical protein [Desulfosporosinus sp.]